MINVEEYCMGFIIILIIIIIVYGPIPKWIAIESSKYKHRVPSLILQ